jgi:hypothetical protein
VISNSYCLVPMTTFTSSPYSFGVNILIQAKVLAHNARGWSAESNANSGTTPVTQSTPSQMTAVSSSSSTSTSIGLSWTAPSLYDSGESAVTSYIVYWD